MTAQAKREGVIVSVSVSIVKEYDANSVLAVSRIKITGSIIERTIDWVSYTSTLHRHGHLPQQARTTHRVTTTHITSHGTHGALVNGPHGN